MCGGGCLSVCVWGVFECVCVWGVFECVCVGGFECVCVWGGCLSVRVCGGDV